MPLETPLGSLHLWCSKSRLPPTFPVGTSTSKLIDSTICYIVQGGHTLKNKIKYMYVTSAGIPEVQRKQIFWLANFASLNYDEPARK